MASIVDALSGLLYLFGIGSSTKQQKQDVIRTAGGYEKTAGDIIRDADYTAGNWETDAGELDADAIHLKNQYNTAIDNMFTGTQEKEQVIREQLSQIISFQGVSAAAGGIRSDSGSVQILRKESDRAANEDITKSWDAFNTQKNTMEADLQADYNKLTGDADQLRTDASKLRTTAQEDSDWYTKERNDMIDTWDDNWWNVLWGGGQIDRDRYVKKNKLGPYKDT